MFVLWNLKKVDEHVCPNGVRSKNEHQLYYSEKEKNVKLEQSLDGLDVPNVGATRT